MKSWVNGIMKSKIWIFINYGRYQIYKSFIMLFRDPDGLVLQNKFGSKNLMAVCPFNSHYRTGFCLPQRKVIFLKKISSFPVLCWRWQFESLTVVMLLALSLFSSNYHAEMPCIFKASKHASKIKLYLTLLLILLVLYASQGVI